MIWFMGLIFFLLWINLHRTLIREAHQGWYFSLAVHALVVLWLETVDGSNLGYLYALIVALPMLVFGRGKARKNS